MGLISNAMPQQQPGAQPVPDEEATDGAPPAAAEGAPEGAGPVADDGAHPDQAAYQRVVQAAMKVIYDSQHGQEIMNILQHSQSPAQGLADATYMLMSELVQLSKGTMPKSVIVPVGKEVMGLIAEMAQKAGIAESPQIMQQAMQIIAQKMAQQSGVSPQQLQQAVAQRTQAKPGPAFQSYVKR